MRGKNMQSWNNPTTLTMLMQTEGERSVMNGGNPGTIDNGFFTFAGSASMFEGKMDTLREDTKGENIVSATITIMGNQVKEANSCCELSTIIIGTFTIFPLFFICCDWWKKMVKPAYDVPVSTYKRIFEMIENYNLSTLTLTVSDTAFGKQKAQALYQALSSSSIRGFTFINISSTVEVNEDEFNRFEENIKPIKNLSMMTDLRWLNKIVL